MPDTTTPILISHLAPKNFLSFGPENPGIDLRALNVFIGANGSGKSNLIEAISFLRAAPAEFSEVTRTGGGVLEWFHKGSSDRTSNVGWTLNYPGDLDEAGWGFRSACIQHKVRFGEYGQRFNLWGEEITEVKMEPDAHREEYFHTNEEGNGVVAQVTGPDGSRILAEPPSRDNNRSVVGQLMDGYRYPELTWMAKTYGQVRIYREWAFGRNSVLRIPGAADARNDYLREDFANLGIFLSRLMKSPNVKRVLVQQMKDLFEGLTDLVVSTEGGTVQIFLHEGEFSIPATRLSDGTLRYLCLLAILCDPDPPPLICIEEPELGLHPDILPRLADLLKAASKRTQIIVTTHSDILVDAMTDDPECVVVCEKHEGKTEMTRLSAADLAVWLEKYRLGQLWIKGQLGGTRW